MANPLPSSRFFFSKNYLNILSYLQIFTRNMQINTLVNLFCSSTKSPMPSNEIQPQNIILPSFCLFLRRSIGDFYGLLSGKIHKIYECLHWVANTLLYVQDTLRQNSNGLSLCIKAKPYLFFLILHLCSSQWREKKIVRQLTYFPISGQYRDIGDGLDWISNEFSYRQSISCSKSNIFVQVFLRFSQNSLFKLVL